MLDTSKYENDELYPEHIHFVHPNALRNDEHPFLNPEKSEKVKVSVFDLDGTSISTSTPMRLMFKLNFEHRLKKRTIFMLASWGIAYKLHLPRKNNPVRQRAFSAFKGMDARDVNRYLAEFFESDIKRYIRQDAIDKMKECAIEGKCVVLLSASFDGVVAQALKYFPAHYGISTQMNIRSDGTYDNSVFGIAPEGHDKPYCLKLLLDEQFGKGVWEIEDCFADHYSDMDVLAMAKNSVAVTPDKRLLRFARRKNMPVEVWN